MSVVPGYSVELESSVNAILSSGDRDNLPVLNPGPGIFLDKTTSTWFKFLHYLSVAIPPILAQGWVHEWPTYRFIPDHYKERWFLILAKQNNWDRRHNLTVWTHFNLLARTIFRTEMRRMKKSWALGGGKPEWMLPGVWLALVDMFEEFGPDNFGF